MNRAVDVISSYTATGLRLGAGAFVGALGPRPAQRLELYEFEGCPFCRRVREALTQLDLQALVHPCPKGGRRFRAAVLARGGKEQFPYLVDPDAGAELYESDAIVRHLYARYGAGSPPWYLGGLAVATGALASGVRAGRGSRVSASRAPAAPLELWSFEASPYCRIAREALCELELPYVLHNVGKGSPSRAAFVARAGRMQVPWLHDPNTGRGMFESTDIVRYLRETYAA